MIRFPAFSARRPAAVLVVLAALFHVQWLAACDVMPMPDHRECCAQDQHGGIKDCDDEVGATACLVPFAAQALSLKLPERLQGADDLPDASPVIGVPTAWMFAPGQARPPDSMRDAVIADGRSLYLTSSRLRL